MSGEPTAASRSASPTAGASARSSSDPIADRAGLPSVLMVANAHIDPVWIWDWHEGMHEVLATFRAA
ncbi:MAG: hypothetical protein ACLP6E_04750, partial [Acidimicrobiales bacterium]